MLRLRLPRLPAALPGLLRGACGAKPSYPEVGATKPAAPVPSGYRHVRQRAFIGRGPEAFATARQRLRGWAPHRSAGVGVFPDDARQEPGVTVLVLAPVGPLVAVAPCRVVWALDEPWRTGFAYGTLPGHPERGEEAFVVERRDDDSVWFTISAFSREATGYARFAAPLVRVIQRRTIGAYLRGLAAPRP